jgi:hypothetical protein
MSRGDDELNLSVLHLLEDSRHRFGLTPDPLAPRVIKRPFEGADVEGNDRNAHRIIVICRSDLLHASMSVTRARSHLSRSVRAEERASAAELPPTRRRIYATTSGSVAASLITARPCFTSGQA